MKSKTMLCIFLTAAMAAAAFLPSCSNAQDEISSSTSSAVSVDSSIEPSVLAEGIYNVKELQFADDKKWTYGEDGQDGSVQGYNSWYYMYTEETNTEGIYDISKIKESWYSDINGGGSCISSGNGSNNKPTWVAGIYSKDSDIASTGNWWDQSMNYMSLNLNPAVENGPYASAILAFKAPEDGNYRLDISFTAGNKDKSDSQSDGITFSVYGNTDKLYSRSVTDNIIEGESVSLNAMLKAGQYFYIISDPNKNGKNDMCNDIRAEITLTIPQYIDNNNSWAFGDGYINGDGTKQGHNGWYYLYSQETNTNGVYDISKIEECRYKQLSETNSYTEKAFGTWLPEIYYEENLTQENNWHQSADGYLSPEMSHPPYASAIIGWKAPEAGRYSFNVSLFAGSASTDDLCDGVDISLYCGSRKVSRKSIKIPSNFIYGFEADLEKDEYMYLIVDPKNTAVSDLAENVNIVVNKLGQQ